MKTRKEIEGLLGNLLGKSYDTANLLTNGAILGVLLDIRDLLVELRDKKN